MTVTSAKPIDERMTRYIDRSSVFEGTQVVEKIRRRPEARHERLGQEAVFLLRHR